MLRRYTNTVLLAIAATFALVAAAVPAQALEVWPGRTFFFSKADSADWTQAANQDRITPLVWLARKDSQGLFNIHDEPGFLLNSPSGTEWATGDAVNHVGLTFQPWREWVQFNPTGTIGVDAVVHLIAEDVYVDVRLESWTMGQLGQPAGGGFSYRRAVRPTTSVVPPATSFALRGFLGNPVRPDTPLEFSLPDGAPAWIEVLDVTGRLIARRDVGSLGSGTHRIAFPELRSQPPELLFVRLTRAGQSRVARATHLK